MDREHKPDKSCMECKFLEYRQGLMSRYCTLGVKSKVMSWDIACKQFKQEVK